MSPDFTRLPPLGPFLLRGGTASVASPASTFDSSTGCSSADRRRLISWFILSASSR